MPGVWPPYNLNVCCDGGLGDLYTIGPPSVWKFIQYCSLSKSSPQPFFPSYSSSSSSAAASAPTAAAASFNFEQLISIIQTSLPLAPCPHPEGTHVVESVDVSLRFFPNCSIEMKTKLNRAHQAFTGHMCVVIGRADTSGVYIGTYRSRRSYTRKGR